jgi:hypothetical protein
MVPAILVRLRKAQRDLRRSQLALRVMLGRNRPLRKPATSTPYLSSRDGKSAEACRKLDSGVHRTRKWRQARRDTVDATVVLVWPPAKVRIPWIPLFVESEGDRENVAFLRNNAI